MHKWLSDYLWCALLLIFISCNGKKADKDSNDQKNGKNSSPIEVLNERIKSDPENASLYFERSKWNLLDKKFAAAETDIKKALTIDSANADYYLHLANVQFANMHIVDAEASFKKVIEQDPDHLDGRLKLSELYLYLKRYEESVKEANEALRIDKHKAKAYFIKGFVYKENKDTARAISSFETAIEQEPTYYDAFIQLGNLYAAHHDPLAIQYYKSALKLQPHSTEALYDRGLFYQEHGEVDKAVNDYNELLKVDPNYANAYFNLGYIAMKYQKDYQQAVGHFTNAMKSQTYFAEAYYNRGVCYENLGDKEKARADYREALNIFPTYDLAKNALKKMGK